MTSLAKNENQVGLEEKKLKEEKGISLPYFTTN